MSERPRTDGSRALDGAPDADRDAKIEQLLLVGLDHYFAAQYDQAINVWTRVLFLDRSHARARAYIERARSALAERQRESEELLQSGVAAFRRGDGDEARRLLQAAIDSGAAPDEALSVLNRLSQPEPAAPQPATRSRGENRAASPRARRAPAPLSGLTVSITLGCALLVAAVSAATAWGPLDWRALLGMQTAPIGAARIPVMTQPSLGLPTRGERALNRARTLASEGRLQDALTLLESIRQTEVQKADADRLRADIQRQLLTLGSIPIPIPKSEPSNP